ncbi:MAG: DUF5018 domain-containing protein [Bacteroidota bacterium]
MRKIYLKFLAILITVAFSSISFSQTQAPNSGFETWTSTLPASWNSISQVNHVSKATPAHSGTNAARLDTKNVILNGAVPGLLTLGTFNSSANTIDGGIAFTEKPDSLVIWYKYYPQTGDTALLGLGIFNNGDTVGKASKFLTTTQSTWKRLSMPITYISSLTPDMLNIGFLSSLKSSAKVGTYLIVDDIQLIYNWTLVCSDPTNLSASSIATNSASLNWNSTGTVSNWQVQYGPAGFALGSGTIVSTTSKPYVLSGLTDDTQYSYYVKANCASGLSSNWAGPYTFKTLSSCFNPANLEATNITTNSASLNWTLGSSESQWIIEWGNSGFTLGAGTTINTSSKPYSLTGLQESTSYSFYVKANCGNGKLSSFAGPYTFSTLSSCPPPSSLSVSNIDIDEAILGWNAGGSETNWVIEWGVSGFTPGTGTLVNTSSQPYLLKFLNNGTYYDFYVKADCGGGKSSTWAGPFTFKTTSVSCDVAISNFPWNESFSEGIIPNCWSQSYVNGVVSWNNGKGNNSNHLSASQNDSLNVFFKITNPTNKGVITKLITPQLDLSNISNIQLTFWHFQEKWSADQDVLKVYYKTSLNGSWNLLNTYSSEIATWTQHTISLPNKSSQYYIAFEGTANYGYGIGIDNVTISGTPATCTAPSNLAVANTTYNSTDISWTETGTATQWVLEWGLQGFTQGTGTIVNTSVPNATLTGLTTNTSYEFYIKANCGSQNSTATGPFTFTTVNNPCGVSTFPWTEGFEGGVIPTCWSEVLVKGTNSWQYLKGNGTSNPLNAHTGTKNAVLKRTITGTDTTRLITPQFDLSHLESPVLKFWHTQQSWGSDQDQLRVYYKTSPTGTWTLLNAYTTSVTSWTERTISLPNKSSQYYIAFEGTAKYGYGACIDDISITGTTVNCAAPTSILTSNAQENQVTINWTENNSATSWEIEYGLSTFTQGSGTTVTFTSKPYTLIGLTGNTAYKFFVRSVCDAQNKSSWSATTNFQTTCGAPISVFPWNEGFEGGVIPTCWSEQIVSGPEHWKFANGGYNSGGVSGSPSAAHTGSYNARLNNARFIADVTKLITPAFNLTSLTNPVLKFWHTQADWDGDQDELRVYYKTSAAGAWTLLQTYTNSILTWTQETITLPNASAEYYIAFEGTAMYGHGACVDDVQVNGTSTLSSEKDILSFSFPQQTVAAVINAANGTVNIQVAYGTNLTTLIPTIGVSIGATINPNSLVARDFTNPVTYIVTAENSTTKNWTITVTTAPFVSSDAEIVSFTHASQTGPAIINSANATVQLEVVYGTNLTAFNPSVTLSNGATSDPLTGSPYNATAPKELVVKAADSTKKDWTITITEAPLLSAQAEILTFTLPEQTGAAVINSQNATITIEVQYNTNLAALTPTITISNNASINPPSGTAQNFNNTIQYTVTAQNGTTQKVWAIIINVAPSNEAEITTFALTAQTAPATISSANATVSLEVTNGTDLTTLTPTIGISQGATINPSSNALVDLSSPYQYTVTAQNGTTQKVWTVTVTSAPPAPDVIVEWSFPNSPDDNIADNGISLNLNKTMTAEWTGTPDFASSGATTNSASSVGWDNGSNAKYWMANFSTVGYKDLKVYSKQNSSSRGPKNFKLQYRIGTTGVWADVPNSAIVVGANWTSGLLFDLPLPTQCNNQQSVYLRWLMSSNTSTYLLLPVLSDASSSIDDITITGFPDLISNINNNASQSISVYPNPVKDELTVTFKQKVDFCSIEIQSIDGKTLINTMVSNSKEAKINLKEFASGIYMLKAIYQNKVEYIKIIK